MEITPELKTQLNEVIEEVRLMSRAPGMAIGIIKAGKLVYINGHGYANREKCAPINEYTVFRLASVSKLFTLIAILQLWELGKFQLDESINTYLPKGKILKKHPDWPDVTFRHLLSHQSGIGEIMRGRDILKPGYGLLVGEEDKIPPLSYLHDRDLTPEIPAGLKYAYSNIGFSLLGYLVEIFSGESFSSYIRKHILDPLEMFHSDFERNDRIRPTEAQGYLCRFGKYKHAKYVQNIIMPAGNLYSCIADMTKFATVLLNRGVPLLKTETFAMALTPQYYSVPAIKDHVSMGLAFFLYRIQNKKGRIEIWEHNGITSGFTSMFSLIPSENLAICVFSNLDEVFTSDYTAILKNRIVQTCLDLPEHPVSENLSKDPFELKRFCGYYRSYPGLLTNTRVFMMGGDFKIKFKNNHLWLSALYGPLHQAIQLIPTSEPLLFSCPVKKRGTTLDNISYYGFQENEQQEITDMGLSLIRLRKVSFFRTFRFKVELLLILILIGVLFALGL
jgi:CubicO group peptidase (beta-lactamase class C family)